MKRVKPGSVSPDELDGYVIGRLRAAGEPVSGEALASELGMSRVALWKRVESLKAWGYGIEASRKGYELAQDDGLAGWELEAPGPVVLYDSVGSTMDEARSLALAGAPSGATVLALGQSSGRARNGGTWESPSGGLYLSVVLRSALPPSRAGALSLEAAAATLRALGANGLGSVEFRWPNEIVAAAGDGPASPVRRKVGGILVEASGDLSAADFFVVGLGLNIAPSALAGSPSSASVGGLTAEVRTPTAARRAAIAARIVRELAEWAAAPSLDPERWRHLVPAGGPAYSIELWNGERRRFAPAGFDARGDLLPAGGGPGLSIGECRLVHIEGEP
ncbi:MAG: biotin--[acetyl-CoA-carboxylase] ligase [Spirochaetes bacterium]|nr:biotin--[acetyl-CoA-carboxylase] ligase [Spirochaetota bacterium]